jgi:hypothetical protein
MKSPKSMRVWFAFMGAMLWTGIYLTGFSTVNGLLYLPACVSVFAAITGVCPSQMIIFKLFKVKIKETPDNEFQSIAK